MIFLGFFIRIVAGSTAVVIDDAAAHEEGVGVVRTNSPSTGDSGERTYPHRRVAAVFANGADIEIVVLPSGETVKSNGAGSHNCVGSGAATGSGVAEFVTCGSAHSCPINGNGADCV